MTAYAVAAAVQALAPGTVYDGQVEPNPTYPYTVLSTRVPGASERSLGASVQGRTVRVRGTVAGETAQQVRVAAWALVNALEGAIPAVSGWSCGPIRQVNERGVEEDRGVAVNGTNRHPLYTVIEFEFTAIRTS